MNLFALSGFINGISAILFGFFVFFKKPKDIVNKTFGLMSVALVVWGISYGFWQLSSNKEIAFFWIRLLSVGSTFIPITFLHWILSLYGLWQKRKGVIVAGYIFTIVLSIFCFTPLYIKDINPQLSFAWWPEAGIVYSIYLLIAYIGLISYALYELIKIYKKTKGHIHEQIKYIILAIILGFGGGATNFPLWYNIPIPPYGNFLVAFYPLILSYAIVKHQLFEIKVVLTSLFMAIISILLLFNIFGSSTNFEYILNGSLFTAFLIFGYLLIKSVLKEIKQREKMEKMAGELQVAYEKVQKLDQAKSEFLSIASHQLRTPLTAIQGYLSLLIEGTYGKIQTKAKRPLNNVFRASRQLNQLVNTLLNISRIEAGKVKLEAVPTSLEEILSRIVEEFKIVAEEKGLYLKLEAPSLLPPISLDEEKINQVIMNIVDNSIKYTDAGGIKITAQEKEKSKVLIKIADTGAGMSKEQLSHLFQKFSRGKAGQEGWSSGAGLGLFVAKQFTELHGGKIWAESDGPGKGSAFYIEIPQKL
jgi:signal transduction histidine kinase